MNQEQKIKALLALEDPRFVEVIDALKKYPGNLNKHLLRLHAAGLLKPYTRPGYSVLANQQPKNNSSDQYQ
jgi:hypothetical protein